LLSYLIGSEERAIRQLGDIVGVWYQLKYGDLPNWVEFEGIDFPKVMQRKAIADQQRMLKYSIPDWMDEHCEKELGATWETELAALNNMAAVILRANTLKTDVLSLQKALAAENVATEILADTPDALRLLERKSLFSSPLFQSGQFEVQDAGSQWIARALDVAPGMRVIDACAGAGGKTLHLSALMENKGLIVALDVEEWKLTELKKRAKRAGAFNIENRWIESNKTIKRLHSTADRLLLDVPCSGLGVLKRNPDTKWKLQPEFLTQVCETQRSILDKYSKMLRKDGKMVYATCSILPSESENQVQWFLEQQEGRFALLEEKRCSPAAHGYDGFYMATLQKVI
jgi:16S rRNA (cytosine967-C5)-methyltransferase